jgi:polar amino acid transport system permease protein
VLDFLQPIVDGTFVEAALSPLLGGTPVEFFVPLLKGTVVTIWVTFFGVITMTIVGIIIGLMKLSRHWVVRWFAIGYIEFFRGTSLIVQMFIWFFVLPSFGLSMPALLVGILAVGMNVGGYFAEVVRSAIQAVPKGQYEASIALNLKPSARMRRIILPQAIRGMLPPWGNLLIELLKGTAIVSLITLHDLTFEATSLNNADFQTLQNLGSALVLYYLLGRFVITPGVRALERRYSRGLARSAA